MNERYPGWAFDNSYTHLPETFYVRQKPVPVHTPQIAILNTALAESLGLNPELLADQAGYFTGNTLPEGADPIAQAYAGHQFGHFTMLGDGRAILLGEHINPTGNRVDIQLKGAGRTPFSRGGDGRAALGPMLREYIISEAMHALSIPTTRSLAVATTGEPVIREQTLPGAILTRVATSHIRVGTFEYAMLQGDVETLQALADYTLQRHYPELQDTEHPHLALLNGLMDQQAALIAQWQCVGFIHGVMNTDNMTLSGETIDYGPCAFMDTYDPATVFSSIDHRGRYAYQNQPMIAQWNLARFAETLLPLLHPEQEQAISIAEEAINTFPERFQQHWLSGMRSKLGLFTEEADDATLVETLLTWMHNQQKDFTHTFHVLSASSLSTQPPFEEEGFAAWHAQWQARLARQPESREEAMHVMLSRNPCIIPRNHQVEAALTAATEHADFSILQKLLMLLQTPFSDHTGETDYYLPPTAGARPYRTFCGT